MQIRSISYFLQTRRLQAQYGGSAGTASSQPAAHIFAASPCSAKRTFDWGRARRVTTLPLAEYLRDKFDSAGNSQLFKDSVDVVTDGMFLHRKPVSDFAVLQTVGDEANHIFFAACQQGHSFGVVKLKKIEVSEGGLNCCRSARGF